MGPPARSDARRQSVRPRGTSRELPTSMWVHDLLCRVRAFPFGGRDDKETDVARTDPHFRLHQLPKR